MRATRRHRADEGDLVLSDDAAIGHQGVWNDAAGGANCSIIGAEVARWSQTTQQRRRGTTCRQRGSPQEATSNDPEVLRAALIRESRERRRAECLATMQTDVVQLALDLLVREPDIEGFFGALTKTMVEEGESHACARLADRRRRVSAASCGWRTSSDRLFTPPGRRRADDAGDVPAREHGRRTSSRTRRAGRRPIEYSGDDARLPEPIREFSRRKGVRHAIVATPLLLGSRTLGWMTLSQHARRRSAESRVVARRADRSDRAAGGAGAASQPAGRAAAGVEERRKAILEERNRLARDIHDNLAQGFARDPDAAAGGAARGAHAAAGGRVAASRPRSISRART